MTTLETALCLVLICYVPLSFMAITTARHIGRRDVVREFLSIIDNVAPEFAIQRIQRICETIIAKDLSK